MWSFVLSGASRIRWHHGRESQAVTLGVLPSESEASTLDLPRHEAQAHETSYRPTVHEGKVNSSSVCSIVPPAIFPSYTVCHTVLFTKCISCMQTLAEHRRHAMMQTLVQSARASWPDCNKCRTSALPAVCASVASHVHNM